ncbi:MAG TPA: methyltransferase domain-containing protein [Gemmatimonadales bacterium]|nr:methyltransferase domain-containing protein [Gemmatimonadales bacterium]
MLDVGRGEGHSATFFRDLGCEVVAVHGSRQTRRDSRIPEAHAVHDFHNGPFVPRRDFDLVWSSELMERVEEAYSGHLVARFAPPGSTF